jgi:poly(beta-D-mannuronate) lyase
MEILEASPRSKVRTMNKVTNTSAWLLASWLVLGCAPDDSELETAPVDDGAADLEAAAACTRSIEVTSSAALADAVQHARPGDCIEVADGSYAGTTVKVKASASKPVSLRAAHRGRATFTSAVRLDGAEFVTLEGFSFIGGAKVSFDDAKNCRLTRSKLRVSGGTWVTTTGKADRNRIDHNDFGELNANGHFVAVTGFSTRSRVDHNYFHDVSPAGGNGRETVQIGCCGATYDYFEPQHVVENNLFVNCNGENEMIGIKSSKNTVRHNTIRTSNGFISLRAGRSNSIYGNYILGGDNPKAGGIRVFEDDHVIYNNYIDTLDLPLALTNGDPPGGAHAAIERVTVAFNTIIVRGEAVKIGGTGHTVPPSGTFANNLLFGARQLLSNRNGGSMAFEGNLAFRSDGRDVGGSLPSSQVRVADPKLENRGGILRPGARSPAVDRASGRFALVSDDIDGRARTGTFDIGAFEASSTLPAGKPLTPADVGPDAP